MWVRVWFSRQPRDKMTDKKEQTMKKYRVVIPYFYEFHVEAENKEKAIEEAHNQTGNMTGYDENEEHYLVEEQ